MIFFRGDFFVDFGSRNCFFCQDFSSALVRTLDGARSEASNLTVRYFKGSVLGRAPKQISKKNQIVIKNICFVFDQYLTNNIYI